MHLLAFLGVCLLVVVTPGVDMALVTKNALLHGRAAAQATAWGVNLGIVFWTVAATLGLAALIAASPTAFNAIKIAGAVYLIYLGLKALRGSHAAPTDTASAVALDRKSAFRQGLTCNLLNPKIAFFFTSLLPQFVDSRHARATNLLLLGAIFNGIGVVWLLSYAALAARGRNVFSRPPMRRALDRVSGVALIGLGVRLSLEHRR